MAIPESLEQNSSSVQRWANWARNGCFWLLVVILAWAPFPLGSNREWSWGILLLLIAACWFQWAIWACLTPAMQFSNLKRVGIPLILAALTLVWAIAQALPLAPPGWDHPIWSITANLLARPVEGTISLNPWKTLGEVMKLSSYIVIAWMAYSLTRNSGRAGQLLNAIIGIGAAYAAYAFVLKLSGIQQIGFFYSGPLPSTGLSGPFVQRNSFATFEGMAAIASCARLVELGYKRIIASKGIRRWALTTLKFAFGSNIIIVLATLITISALVASASRGGVFSTLCALIVMTLPFALLLKRSANRKWILIGSGAAMCLLIALIWISSDSLAGRFEDLVDAGNADAIRVALWSAGERMITDAPFLGLGLGTFQDAYPMYATQVFPFIMDKAHSDYLEFAAGLGLPAAFCWWVAILWLMAQMSLGFFRRKRDKIYPLVGVGATVLVAIHSSVDFSLQIPAVAMTYAALLGVGLAQSYSIQKSHI